MKQLCLLAITIATISCNSQVIKKEKSKNMETTKTIVSNKTSDIQDSYIITYEETKNMEDQLSQVPESLREQVRKQLTAPTNYDLTIYENSSIYEKQDLSKKSTNSDDLKAESGVQIIQMKGKSRAYKNRKTNQYLNESSILGKDFLISDELRNIDWILNPDTKKIGQYDCKKATTTIDNSPVEAWYTASIPVSDGPDEFWGLPGLIIEVKTINKNYLATQIIKSRDTELIVPSKGKKVTKLEFEKAKSESIEEIQNSYRSGN